MVNWSKPEVCTEIIKGTLKQYLGQVQLGQAMLRLTCTIQREFAKFFTEVLGDRILWLLPNSPKFVWYFSNIQN